MRLLILILLSPIFCISQNLQQYYAEAMTAYKDKKYDVFYEKIKEANQLHPYHQGIQYQLGLAAALNGKTSEAILFLKKAILTNANFVIEKNQDLKSLFNLNEYQSLLDLQKKLQQVTTKSDTAFIIKDRQLHVEGIDYDSKTKTFYLGSIHKRKVITIDGSGLVSDFTLSEADGMTSVFGLKVDNKRNLLWVCSSPMPEMQNFDSTARSAVFKYDLKTKRLLQKYPISKYEPDGVFGDLILNSKGVPYVSDGKNNKIFIVNETTEKLESIYSSDEFWNLQGLTFSADEKFLYLADYIKGIFRLNLTSKLIEPVTTNLDVSLKGIDGLYFFNNSLLAIQNGTNPFRLSRYSLNKDGNEIIKTELLENNHPAFGEPTLGVINENNFLFIANSQWGGYDNNHQPKPVEKLQDIVILKQALKIK